MATKELTYDEVPLHQARYICNIPPEGEYDKTEPYEVYLLAECTAEQFAEFQKTQYPVKLGYYYKPDWTAGLPFYLFRCLRCSQYQVSQRSGVEPFLYCRDCSWKNLFCRYRIRNFRD